MTILIHDIEEKFNRDSHDTYWELKCYDFQRHTHHRINARPKTRWGKPIRNFRQCEWDTVVDHLLNDCYVECHNITDDCILPGENNPNDTVINGDTKLTRKIVTSDKTDKELYRQAVRTDKRNFNG